MKAFVKTGFLLESTPAEAGAGMTGAWNAWFASLYGSLKKQLWKMNPTQIP